MIIDFETRPDDDDDDDDEEEKQQKEEATWIIVSRNFSPPVTRSYAEFARRGRRTD